MPRIFFVTMVLVAVWPFVARPEDSAVSFDEEEIEDDELEAELFFSPSDVVTSAARHEQNIGMSPSAITLITRQDIESSGATTFVDLLRLVPGMTVITLSPFSTSLSARLQRNDQNFHFLVLIDGREANLEMLGQTHWESLSISIEDVERIEIIRGPASAIYGANALAGVINITTRTVSEKRNAYFYISGSDTGMTNVRAHASDRFGDLGISISGGLDTSGAFLDPRSLGKEVWKARSLFEYRLGESSRVLLDASFSDSLGPFASILGRMTFDYQTRIVRLAYESKSLRGHLYWTQIPIEINAAVQLQQGKIVIAEFVPMAADSHTIDGEIQWTLPSFWEPLLLIVGGNVRAFYFNSDMLLDAESFTDINSPRYHEPGIDQWEFRTNAFMHSELSLAEWITITLGLRLDYNTATGEFFSPRAASVFQPIPGQFIRVGVARAFRKPTPYETYVHPMVTFPKEGPLQGKDQDLMLEFMTRVIGNRDLDNEKLLAFELGYLGQFFENRLSISLELYFNMLQDMIHMVPNLRYLDSTRTRIDFQNSGFQFVNNSEEYDIMGGELTISFEPTKNVSLLASWSYHEVYIRDRGISSDDVPKNQFTLGGNFSTDVGFVGSLYAFTRSEHWDRMIPSPGGMLESYRQMHLDHSLLLLGKIGYRENVTEWMQFESGIKLLLPICPWGSSLFRNRDEGGGVSTFGEPYGGYEYGRMVTFYLLGVF